ncbi:hypothetical protein PHYPO_G00009390 [Pangasianodon hypophthalmus]|uniref:EF-hand domain-containing protein n=1 Tax=Pangasianodon hypophthalmus TaxID=310915 RepID=A0A5N5Q517_PANHP|nr:hypothetical protein PHYPO_G00009390 [Pangasianodon hypophthalmus]
MARYSLWVAALGLVCLIAVVTSDNNPQTESDASICAQFLDGGSTMSIARVFDMIEIKLKSYVPDMGTEMMRDFMKYADNDRDDHLNQSECQNLINYLKNRTPARRRK